MYKIIFCIITTHILVFNTLLICKLSEEQRIKQFSEPKP